MESQPTTKPIEPDERTSGLRIFRNRIPSPASPRIETTMRTKDERGFRDPGDGVFMGVG